MLQHPMPLLKAFMIINLGSIIYGLSSSSWLGVWVGMELNLYSFTFMLMVSPIPLFSNSSTSNAMIYFLVQAVGSLVLILSVIMLFNVNSSVWQVLLMLSLMMKVGVVPFHFWVPWTAVNISWLMVFWILSVQKFMPLLMIYNVGVLGGFQNGLFFFVVGLSAFLGGLLGLFQSRLQPLLAYSSINQAGWMMLTITYSMNLFFVYFFFYSLVLLLIILIFEKNYTASVGCLPVFFNFSSSVKLNLVVLFFILAGIPPSIVFFFKANIFFLLLYQKGFVILVPFLIIGSLLTTFFYLQIILYLLMPSVMIGKSSKAVGFNVSGIFVFTVFLMGPLFMFVNFV
uniref:NADH-ubiquinone oxidoreductase chain 2 n=1 Tax=Spiochaetopterus sp. TaxID=3127495 RepID=A0AB39A5X6_9ANNE